MSLFLSDHVKQAYSRISALKIEPWFLYLFVALVVWLPEGLNIGPSGSEDWGLLRRHSGPRGTFFDVMPDRLFRDIPVWLGMHITPHSFQGWQAMILILTILRGILFYEIIRRMVPMSRYFAIACGLLVMFHPTDSGYFLLNTTGVQFSIVLAFASCLFALIHLEKGSWSSLILMFAFQSLSGFTYSAFIPIMFAIPAGAWLLSWLAGKKQPLSYLFKVAIGVVVLLILEWYTVQHGIGKDAQVADFNIHKIILGYLLQTSRLFDVFGTLGDDFLPRYFLFALLAGLLALWAAYRRGSQDEGNRSAILPWHWYAAVVAGLLVLAVLAYLPYSISYSRGADRRQLLLAGTFFYAAALFLVFLALQRWSPGWRAPVAVVALVATLTTLAGLDKRNDIVGHYRALESLISSVATIVPDPPRHTSVIIYLTDEHQAYDVYAFYHENTAFSTALQFMYGKPVAGRFFGFGIDRGVIAARGLQLQRHSRLVVRQEDEEIKALAHVHKARKLRPVQMDFVSYKHMFLIAYPGYAKARKLDAKWLKQNAPSPDVAHAIRGLRNPKIMKPASSNRVCTMLESRFRPEYCHR